MNKTLATIALAILLAGLLSVCRAETPSPAPSATITPPPTVITLTSLQELTMDLRVDRDAGAAGLFDLYGVRVNGTFLL